MHKILFALSLALAACATAPPPAATQPCRLSDATINATLWMQTSAEYQAITREVYGTAARNLDAARVRRLEPSRDHALRRRPQRLRAGERQIARRPRRHLSRARERLGPQVVRAPESGVRIVGARGRRRRQRLR